MQIEVVDSHTGGEPTRVVVGGWDVPAGLSASEVLEYVRTHQDHLRKGVCREPRGSDVLVGALLFPPKDQASLTGLVFFVTVGYLGMCGHGTIGVVETLKAMGKVSVGTHVIETPVGNIRATLLESGEVEIENIPAYRYQTGVSVEVSGYGRVTGDIAYGGNWFFLVTETDFETPSLSMTNVNPLTRLTVAIRESLERDKVTGMNGEVIDHVELFAPSELPDVQSKNFVLCPGLSYDRSPCGTGTSAKLACLAASGKLKPEEPWGQESITGSVFHAYYTLRDGQVIPHIRGRASLMAKSTLIFQEDDMFQWGID